MNTKLVKELKNLRKEVKRLRKVIQPKPKSEGINVLPDRC